METGNNAVWIFRSKNSNTQYKNSTKKWLNYYSWILYSISLSISISYFPFQILIFTRKCGARESIVDIAWRCWFWRMMLMLCPNSSKASKNPSHSIPTLLSLQTRCTIWSSRDTTPERLWSGESVPLNGFVTHTSCLSRGRERTSNHNERIRVSHLPVL